MDISSAIDSLFSGAVPERHNEIKEYFGEQQDRAHLLDGPGFLMHEIYGVIQVNELALKQIWFIGYASWQAVERYSFILKMLESQDIPLDFSLLESVPGWKDSSSFSQRITEAVELGKVQTVEDFAWPAEIPFPEEGIMFTNIKDKAVYDLVCMAGCYIFLHEFGHIRISMEEKKFAEKVYEELACDKFAKDMMLTKIHEYIAESGEPEHLVRAKRVLGILLANLVILTVTPRQNWRNSESHPDVRCRIKDTLDEISNTNAEWLWPTTAALLVAYAKHFEILDSPIRFENVRHLAYIVCDKF